VRGPKADYDALRALFEGCTVHQECLEAALAAESLVGLWGGTDERQRRAGAVLVVARSALLMAVLLRVPLRAA
jgi:Transcription factor WhiB